LVDLLATQVPYSSEAKNSGFDIMAQIEGAVNDVPATAGDPAAGSDLVNHLLLCMYDPAPDKELSSYPKTFPDNFSIALTPAAAAHGAFGERSGASTSPVFSRPYSAPFTGIAPPKAGLPIPTPLSWGSIVVNTPARVVFYGFPATPADPKTYDWRTIPHDASFDPNIIIGVCLDADATENNAAMVNEVNEVILAFEDAYFLTPATAGTCSQTLAQLDGNGPFHLAGRLVRSATGLLTPKPLMAAVLSPGGVGGRSSKCCSKIGLKNVSSVSLALTPVKTPIKVNTDRFSLTATATSGTDLVNGTKITLSTSTNNGTPTTIRFAPGIPCASGVPPVGITGTGTNTAGKYKFDDLCFTNTGTVFITATANVEDRADTPVTKNSNKINVKP
jgi:hypothetical protein